MIWTWHGFQYFGNPSSLGGLYKFLGMEVGAITPHVCPWNKSRLPGHSQMAQEDLKKV